jgi:hypothetical protein
MNFAILRWENVAKAIPPGLLTGPQRMDFIKAAVKTFQIKTSEIAVGARAPTREYNDLTVGGLVSSIDILKF